MPFKTIAFFIFLFILIRSINFPSHLNFSFDQAWTSTRALEIWKNKEITLVGPGNSIITGGKQMIQGSINYYFQLIFLLLGNFDPVISSYLFMIFSALMILPLYSGVKYLYDDKVALVTVTVYCLLPLYIDFTRFLFGPNFQFSFVPLIIFLTGKYKQTGKLIYYFLIFFLIGFISQFHFATLIFLPMFYIYIITLRVIISSKERSNNKLNKIIVASLGFLIGFSPILIFEVKNKFYNLTILMEYFRHSRSLSNFELLPHRYLSLSLILIIFLIGHFKKLIANKVLFVSCFLLLILDIFLYLPVPTSGFGMSKNWNYPSEKKAFEIIKKQNIKNYNIANIIYDNKAVVIKYLMKREGIIIDYDNYYQNKYLYVISVNEKIINNNPAYEVKTFVPRKKIEQWKLNEYYNLYLFERNHD